MQILPLLSSSAAGGKTSSQASAGANASKTTAGASGFFLAAGGKSSLAVAAKTSGSDAHGFSRMIREHLEGRPARITPLEHGVADSNPHSLAVGMDDMFVSRSPYLKTNAKQDAAHSSQEIRFMPAEVRKIAKSLRESGVDPAVAQEVTQLAYNPLGVTAPDMLKAMAEVIRKPVQMTDGDMVQISSLLQRVVPEGELSGQILADVRNGKTTQAWQKILDALKGLDAGSQVALEQDEVLSLGKGLGLSEQTLDALRKAFGNNSRIELRPDQVENFLAPLRNELDERQAQTEKLAAAFEKVLSPVAQEARMRIAAEESAAGRAARNIRHSVVLIEDTVTRNGLTRQNSVNAPQTDANAAPQDAAAHAAGRRNAANAQQVDANAATQDAAGRAVPQRNAASAPQADAAAAPQRAETLPQRGGDDAAHGESRREGADAGHQDRTAGWADFLDRIRYQDRGAPNQDWMNDIPQSLSAAPTLSQAGQAAQPAPQPVLPSYAPQVLRQVEQGLLTGMRDGTQRLELQLSPEHLGALTMVLTVKNGEISALLRPERSETAVLLNQQTDQLRFTLEQQGIKVDKVEVQMQMQDDRNTMTWQGMAHHNAAQEQQARAEQGRILRIGRLHRGGSDALDQKMQETGHNAGQAADLAEHGLHIIT